MSDPLRAPEAKAGRLARSRAVLRDEGVRGLWIRALAAAGIYRRLIFAERSLASTIADVGARIPVVVRALGSDETDAYVAFRPDQDPGAIHRRFAERHWCFAVWHEERIVHVAWAEAGRARVEYLCRAVDLPSADVYVYDVLTAPAFRGLGISAARSAWIRTVTAFLPESRSAWAPLEKVGYHRIGMIGYVRIGAWRHDFDGVTAAYRRRAGDTMSHQSDSRQAEA